MLFVWNFDLLKVPRNKGRGVLQASGESWRGGKAASLVVYAICYTRDATPGRRSRPLFTSNKMTAVDNCKPQIYSSLMLIRFIAFTVLINGFIKQVALGNARQKCATCLTAPPGWFAESQPSKTTLLLRAPVQQVQLFSFFNLLSLPRFISCMHKSDPGASLIIRFTVSVSLWFVTGSTRMEFNTIDIDIEPSHISHPILHHVLFPPFSPDRQCGFADDLPCPMI